MVVGSDDGDENRSKAARQAANFIRDEIVSGNLKPGTQIPARELATGQHSLEAIREGITRLLATQLVSDGSRFRVASQNADDLADLMHTRFLLEGVALRDSIMNGDHSWEKSVTMSLESLLDVQPNSWRSPAAAAIHKRFHQSLISASALKRVVYFLNGIYDQCSWYSVVGEDGHCANINGHRTLAEAALSRDPEAASEQLRMLLFPQAPHTNGRNGATMEP